MNQYIAKLFNDGEVYKAIDVNRIENQLESLTSIFNSFSALNNIYIRYDASEPEPEDKTVLFIDLSDELENNTSVVEGILNEYKISIENLSNELYELKETVSKLISSGGIIIPDIEQDTNNYLLLEEGSYLLLEDNSYLLCENDFEIVDNSSSVINNCILTEDNKPFITEDEKYIVMEV